MKILHTIPSLGINSGGTAQSVSLLVRGLREAAIDAGLLTCHTGKQGGAPTITEDYVHTLPPTRTPFAYAPGMRQWLRQTPFDIYHAHSVWLYPPHATAHYARSVHKPCVISPRGMLYPEDMAHGKLKKRACMELFLRKDLCHAACIHATCAQEMHHIRALGIARPVAVIPNCVDISVGDAIPRLQNIRRIGYLGRIHPRKRIERLLYAWSALGGLVADCELVIIGDGDRQYTDFLLREKSRLRLDNVIFTGLLAAGAKSAALDSLSYLALPSDFENFGNVVAEALERGIPVICTRGAPWEELHAHDCGWWVDNNVESLSEALRIAIGLPEPDRLAMGHRGRSLITQNYSMSVVASQMNELYAWLLGYGIKPEFVYE